MLAVGVTQPASAGRGVAPPQTAPSTARPALVLTYVANSGVLVAAGDRKILIDALFDRPNPAYRAPSAETIDRMVDGIAPFDGVTAALVTHNHPDHFDPRVALRFLESRRDAVLVAPGDAVAAMRSAAPTGRRLPRVSSRSRGRWETAACWTYAAFPSPRSGLATAAATRRRS
jgi:glyoxylase-like metal-dependent hydrolase (beta-lactamase superfamily II)